MKIHFVSHLDSSTQIPFLVDAARKRGHEVLRINPQKDGFFLPQDQIPVICSERAESQIEAPDVAVIRMGWSATPHRTYLVRQLQNMGTLLINDPAAHENAGDKMRTASVLHTHGLPTPATLYLPQHAAVEPYLKHLPQAPWIVKIPRCGQGKGVLIAETKRSLVSICDVLRYSENTGVIIQEFQKSPFDDLRILLCGDDLVGAMVRRPSEKDFRANISQGGSATRYECPPEILDLAIKAKNALGLIYAGVDILINQDGPKILEVNGGACFEGLQSAHDYDIADRIIAGYERHHASHSKR